MANAKKSITTRALRQNLRWRKCEQNFSLRMEAERKAEALLEAADAASKEGRKYVSLPAEELWGGNTALKKEILRALKKAHAGRICRYRIKRGRKSGDWQYQLRWKGLFWWS